MVRKSDLDSDGDLSEARKRAIEIFGAELFNSAPASATNSTDESFDIDLSNSEFDIDENDTDKEEIVETEEVCNTDNNKYKELDKREVTHDKLFINNTRRGKENQKLFNAFYRVLGGK